MVNGAMHFIDRIVAKATALKMTIHIGCENEMVSASFHAPTSQNVKARMGLGLSIEI
jgi:hypothetical protein